jgi:hypothetical protein
VVDDLSNVQPVIIGRDVLALGQLIATFDTGSWLLQLDASKLKSPS